jgi:glycosyltransferase involved in cell wall biosynthesis
VKNIAEELARKFDVTVCATDPLGGLPKKEEINGVKVKRFKSWAPNNAYYFSGELRKYLAENSENYDIVHAHSYHDFPAFYAAQAKNRNKLVFTPHYHGEGHTFFRKLLHIPYKFLAKKVFEKADKIVCVSNYEKELIIDHFKINGKKAIVIPNGVNLEEFNGLVKTRKDHKVILYVGRLEKYKGVEYLIRMLPNLDKDKTLEVVGKGFRKKSLVKLTKNLGVESRVEFYQDLSRSQLLQKFKDADIFVSLSKHEAFGISIAEALASKTPCIVANTSALKEWIDGKNCFGVEYPIDLEKLASLIGRVIGKSAETPKLLNWNEVTERLVNLYKELLDV